MHFTPAPTNDFPEFIAAYYERCKARVPAIEGNGGKWTLEDLIPGLSDFDTRFFVHDGMTAGDWCGMSTHVGQVHLELAQERRDWARNLEHLPGVNLTWSELLDPANYFTEFSQWSFWQGDAVKIDTARHYIGGHAWTEADALYHWKKIALYYGRYDRAIDPAINLGAYENKYPLHSRLMHYLAPPLHSALCLKFQKTTPGKLQSFRNAVEVFPNPATMQLVLSLIERHYEAPAYLMEPGLTELDDCLEDYLTRAVTELLPLYPNIACSPNPTPPDLKAAVCAATGPPGIAQFFEQVKFARLMKGRLWFYGQDVLWFDSEWLIRNELNRLRANFLETPLRLFTGAAYGEAAEVERALVLLQGDVFASSEVSACRRFAELADPVCADAELKTRALFLAEHFDPFLHALEHLGAAARQRFAA